MFCRHCGKKLPDDSRFCTFCGKSVAVSDETLGDEPEEAPAPVDDAAGDASAELLDPDAVKPGDAVQVDESSVAEGDAQDAAAAEGAPSSLFSDSAREEVGDIPVPDDSAGPVPPEDPAPTDGSTSENADAQAPDAFTYEKGEGDQPDESARGFSGFSIPDGKRRPLIIGARIALALVVGGGVWASSEMARAEEDRAAAEAQEARERERAEAEAEETERMRATGRNFEIDVDATFWNKSGSGPIPVEIEGETASGDSERYVRFVDPDCIVSDILPGSYELTVLASPIAADGKMYLYDDDGIDFSIDEDDGPDETIDLTDDVTIELVRAWRGEVTEADIDDAYEYLLDADVDNADELRDLAREEYLETEDDKKDEDADDDDDDSSSTSGAITRSPKAIDPDPSDVKLPSGTEARVYEGPSFSIKLPLAWDIRLASGGGDIKDRYTISSSNEDILIIDVKRGDAQAGSDIRDANGTEKLGMTSDGDAVVAIRGQGNVAYNLIELIAEVLDTIEIY